MTFKPQVYFKKETLFSCFQATSDHYCRLVKPRYVSYTAVVEPNMQTVSEEQAIDNQQVALDPLKLLQFKFIKNGFYFKRNCCIVLMSCCFF